MYMMYYSFDSPLSEKLVVPVISTFSDMHSVVVYSFPYYCSAGWLNCCLSLDYLCLRCGAYDDDVIGPSPGMGRHSWYQSSGFAHLRLGVELVVHFASSTSI